MTFRWTSPKITQIFFARARERVSCTTSVCDAPKHKPSWGQTIVSTSFVISCKNWHIIYWCFLLCSRILVFYFNLTRLWHIFLEALLKAKLSCAPNHICDQIMVALGSVDIRIYESSISGFVVRSNELRIRFEYFSIFVRTNIRIRVLE